MSKFVVIRVMPLFKIGDSVRVLTRGLVDTGANVEVQLYGTALQRPDIKKCSLSFFLLYASIAQMVRAAVL